MTSKEALDWFKRQEKRQNNGNGDLWLKMYINAIEKDLEVLELLKAKHVDIAELKEDDNIKIYNMSMMKQDRLSEEEFKMLKEWLQND